MDRKYKSEKEGPEKEKLATESHFFNKESNPAASPIHPILKLQNLIGNEATTALIQTKLQISQPGDVCEQEADRIAEQVMRMPEPIVEQVSNETARKLVQTKAEITPTTEINPDLEGKIRSCKGNGQPLAASIRAFFEPRFGVDFKNVRVHNGRDASELARTVNARAFTIGSDIVFGFGHYNHETESGKQLLAHELTHVIQQSDSNLRSLFLREDLNCRKIRTAFSVTRFDNSETVPSMNRQVETRPQELSISKKMEPISEEEKQELIQLTEPTERTQSASPEVGMTKTVAEAFKYILDHWAEFQFDEAYIDRLKNERIEKERLLNEIRKPFVDKRQSLLKISKTLTNYLALKPKAKQGDLGKKALDDLASQETELEMMEIAVRKNEEKEKDWSNHHQKIIQGHIKALQRRKPEHGSDEQVTIERIAAIKEIERTALSNFIDAKKWIDRTRKGYKATERDPEEIAAAEVASMSTTALCNVISYWIYGTVTKRESRSFALFFREEVQRGLIRAQGVRHKGGVLIAVKGIYYGTGSGEWRHRWGMQSMVNERIPLSHPTRKQEYDDFLASGAKLAISWQAVSGAQKPGHFHLIYKDKDGWHNLDHTSTDSARRFGPTQWSKVFGVYFNEAKDTPTLLQIFETFFGKDASWILEKIIGAAPESGPPVKPP